MTTEIRRYRPSDLAALSSLIRDPSLAPEFDLLQGPSAIEAWLVDPFHDPQLLSLVFVNGEPAGFGGALILRQLSGTYAIVRLGVIEAHRRRSLATQLLERVDSGLRERHPEAHELSCSFWLPAPAAEAFVTRRGFQRMRTFWMMERPRGAVPEPTWPTGIRLQFHDGSERNYRDITAAYNDSFAEHYHSPVTTVEETRALFTRPGFRTDGYVLAYRGDTCLGFCRCELHAQRGEIGILGTVEAARGIGLGRALLRWGVGWLEREGAGRVTLLVDGENENALRLYRSEGFEVARTRAVFSRFR
jgi:mycothiol synthase